MVAPRGVGHDGELGVVGPRPANVRPPHAEWIPVRVVDGHGEIEEPGLFVGKVGHIARQLGEFVDVARKHPALRAAKPFRRVDGRPLE